MKRIITITEIRDTPGVPDEYRIKIESGKPYIEDMEMEIPLDKSAREAILDCVENWIARLDPYSVEEFKLCEYTLRRTI